MYFKKKKKERKKRGLGGMGGGGGGGRAIWDKSKTLQWLVEWVIITYFTTATLKVSAYDCGRNKYTKTFLLQPS